MKNTTQYSAGRQFSDEQLDQAFSGARASLEQEGYIFSDERQISTSEETEKVLERQQVEQVTGELKNFSPDMLEDEENLNLC